MDALHDLVQTLVNFLGRPGHTHGVLRHFETGSGHAASVDSLAGSEELASSNELIHSLGGAAHVRNLGYAQRFLCKNGVGIFAVELVLGGTGQIDVGLLLPRFLSFEEGGAVEVLSIRCADVVARSTQLQQVVNLLRI